MEQHHLRSMLFPVLGPLFFLMYINGASDLVFSPGTHITIYADDILLSKPVVCDDDFLGLQTDLNSLFRWSVLHSTQRSASLW